MPTYSWHRIDNTMTILVKLGDTVLFEGAVDMSWSQAQVQAYIDNSSVIAYNTMCQLGVTVATGGVSLTQ